jgi:hypothetical protein
VEGTVQEILPGVHHWQAHHAGIGAQVSSWYLPEGGVLIDPMVPAEGVHALPGAAPPTDIVLSNRHHYRGSDSFVKAFGCRVHCHRAGLHEFTAGEVVEPFEFGDRLPGGLIAHEIAAICPEETALELPGARAMAFADGLVRFRAPEIGFVPDELLGDDPEGVRAGLIRAFDRLLSSSDFAHLLLAHGGPVLDGRAELERLVAASQEH